MEKKTYTVILVILITVLIVLNYQTLDTFIDKYFNEREEIKIERVIDGDTVVVKGNSIRLLGINAPEKGEDFYEESKEQLKKFIENKTVYLEQGRDKRDKYGRILGYLYVNGKNINIRLVERGLANFYYPSGKDKYYYQFKDAWVDCVDRERNLCIKSKNACAECMILKQFDYVHERVIFRNMCSFDCDITGWKIHDEGRKRFIFPEIELKPRAYVEVIAGSGIGDKDTLFWTGENYVWTRTGDTLFLRDNESKLVLWQSY